MHKVPACGGQVRTPPGLSQAILLNAIRLGYEEVDAP
jgi:hypothetical protein